MPTRIQLGKEPQQHINPKFVAYRLVFAKESDALSDITAELIVEMLARKGYSTTNKTVAEWLNGWCQSGLLRRNDHWYTVA